MRESSIRTNLLALWLVLVALTLGVLISGDNWLSTEVVLAVTAALIAGLALCCFHHLSDSYTFYAEKTFALARTESRLRQQQAALLRAVTSSAFKQGDVSGVIRELCELSSETLEVERVNVWRFNENQSEIYCINHYQRSRRCHTAGLSLTAKEAPRYFEAIRCNRILAISDVKKDPRSNEFTHLGPAGVGAMLDAPIHVGGSLVGIICHEHVGGIRHWSSDQQTFAASIADIIALALEAGERRQLQEALAEHKDFLRLVLDTNPSLIFVKDKQGRFTLVNEAVATVYGTDPESLLGKTDSDFNKNTEEVAHFSADDLEVINKRIEKHIPIEHVTNASGDDIIFETIKRPIIMPKTGEVRVLGVARDITAEVRLREQLIQSQKMEAVGQLAGGIAHDFNNLLTGIIGFAHLLKMRHKANSSVTDVAEQIERTASQAGQLTQKLLGFARQGKHQHIGIDAHQTIADVIAILERTLESDITITQSLSSRHRFVQGDPVQVQQVLLNLALNARDSMREETGGTHGGHLTISTRDLVLPDPQFSTTSSLAPGRYIEIAVSDTGCGIPEEHLSRIFEPFFTTKPNNRGSGMGLAMVYGIVENHGGALTVTSSPGKGTTFRVFLPEGTPAPLEQAVERITTPRLGRGTILLVDDHQVIRDVTAQMLSQLGYEVVSVIDGQAAVDYYRLHWQEINLVILDMVMPRMSARECFKELKTINPKVRAILSTGYVNNHAVHEILNDGMSGFVQKPYHFEELSAVVADALRA